MIWGGKRNLLTWIHVRCAHPWCPLPELPHERMGIEFDHQQRTNRSEGLCPYFQVSDGETGRPRLCQRMMALT